MTARTARKGAETKQPILTHALSLAPKVGIEAGASGRLAEGHGMWESGLSAHLQSKQARQVRLLETGADGFVEGVVRPAVRPPRGESWLVAVFDSYLAWESWGSLPDGCALIAGS